MEFTHRLVGKVCIVEPHGFLFTDTLRDLQSLLNPLLEAHAIRGVIVNLEEVEAIASSGVGCIIVLFKSLAAQSIPLVICGSNENVADSFRHGQLNRVIRVYSDERGSIDGPGI